MALYMYQAAYTGKSWAAQLEIRKIEPTRW